MLCRPSAIQTMSDADNSTSIDSTELAEWHWAFVNILIWLLPLLLAIGIVFNMLCFATIAVNSKLFPKIARMNMLIITGCNVTVLAVYGTSYYQKTVRFTFGTAFPMLMDYVNSGNAPCKILLYLEKFLMHGAPFYQIALTLERVLAVVAPLKVKRLLTVKRNWLLLASLTILGSIAPAIWAAEFFHNGIRCRTLTDDSLLTKLDELQYNFDFYLSKAALFAVLLAGCVVVAVALKRRSATAAQIAVGKTGALSNRSVGTCVIMILTNVFFFLSQGPRAAMSVYEGVASKYDFLTLTEVQLDMIYLILYWVSFLHNIADPFAYFMGKRFRSAFTRVILGLCLPCRRNPIKSRSSEQRSDATSGTGANARSI